MFNPENSFAPDMVNLSADFTGDGWPDVLSSLGNRHMDLYVNPAGESRRWDKFSVLPTISSEIVLMKDLDKDGKPEIIFGQAVGDGGYAWAKPDPANPTAVWTPHSVWAPGQAVNGHGLGVGDVNGDGRRDIVVPTGWYEQPAGGINASPWPFHEAELADPAVFGSGGGEMGVYDVNGDGLTDVVAGTGHNWGVNWFEQKKDGDGSSRHNIAQDFSTASTNMGGVVFSESHGARFADMDGDKIPDMITGKRYWSEAGQQRLDAQRSVRRCRCSTSTRPCAIPKRRAARASCRSWCTTSPASARPSMSSTSTRTASWTSSSGPSSGRSRSRARGLQRARAEHAINRWFAADVPGISLA